MEVLPALLYGFPEACLMLAASLLLFRYKISFFKLFMGGLGMAAISLITRYFLFETGYHTVVFIVAIVIVLTTLFRMPLLMAVLGAFYGIILLLAGESTILRVFLAWHGLSIRESLGDPWLHIISGWVSASFLVVSVVVLAAVNKHSRGERKDGER